MGLRARAWERRGNGRHSEDVFLKVLVRWRGVARRGCGRRYDTPTGDIKGVGKVRGKLKGMAGTLEALRMCS